MPSKPRTPPRRRRAPALARQEILDAADRVFAAHAPDRVGLKEIAAAAGVSHALVTHYFGTYSGLIEATFERRIRTLRETVIAQMGDAGALSRPNELLGLLFRTLQDPVHVRLTRWLLASERPAAAQALGMQDHGIQLVAAQVAAALDPKPSAALVERLGRPTGEFDERELKRRISELVARYQGATLADLQMGRVILEISRASGEGGVLPPHELAMLGKALLNLDEVSRTLDPNLDPNAVIRSRSVELLRQSMWKRASPGHLVNALMEAREFAEMLPGRVNRILQRIADNDLRVRVDAIDENTLMAGFQKVANRIATGLVLAALILGAALLMRVDTGFRILGYPGLALLLFLAAAAGGLWLVLVILVSDARGAGTRRRKGR